VSPLGAASTTEKNSQIVLPNAKKFAVDKCVSDFL